VIVIGIDPHKRSHTAAGVDEVTGELRAEKTVPARERGHGELLVWARSLDDERLWAIEDCRHVSGSLERFLLARGERVVRVPPRLMGEARKGGRERGKSDPIDALAVARAALREPDLPAAFLAGREREIQLLLDHRDDLIAQRTAMQNRLRWHLHDLDAGFELPAGALGRLCWLERIAARLRRHEQSAQVRVARELVVDIRRLTRRANELERELTALVEQEAAPLLALPGCAALTAAKVIAEVAGAHRFATEAKLARHAGSSPLPASSGDRQRHRLNRSGNRQLNCALHRIAITQKRVHPPAIAYLARKEGEGKSRREALRCLKRQLARVVFRALKEVEIEKRLSQPTSCAASLAVVAT
jgi:transposase